MNKVNYTALQMERLKDYHRQRFKHKTGLFLIIVIFYLFITAIIVGSWLLIWGKG
jgi:hypothetical protein